MKNIEEVIIDYLNDALGDVSVSADMPQVCPDVFVTVERKGGGLRNVVIENADVAIQVWAKTRYDAAILMERIGCVMQDIIDIANITKVSRDTVHNWPDPDHSMVRYQGVFKVVFYKED